jgi:hypothetical protein
MLGSAPVDRHENAAKRSGRSRAFLAGLLALITLCAMPSLARAATSTVTSNADSGSGTLRADLAIAGAGDTILIPGSFTIVLASPLTVTQAAPGGVTIGASGTGRPTISGNNATGIFQTNASTSLTIDGLMLTGGNSGGDGSAIAGGASATVNVNDSVLSGNGSSGASGDGGAIQLLSSSTLTIQRSTLANNHGGTSSGDGGAIQANSSSTVTISASTLSGNHSGSATGDGGAIQMNSSGTLTLTNSTFFGNAAGLSTGLGGAIQTNSGLTATLMNDTISGNQATLGGGIYANSSGVTATNTIISGNSAPSGANCGGSANPPIASGGYNLENDTSCSLTSAGDLNADPKLDTQLRNNGGETSTLALLPGSPAIDTGDDSKCPSTDQRGVTRPQGAHCDIGAYEFQSGPSTTTLQLPDTIIVRATFKKKTHRATFSFSGVGTTTGFQCELIKPKKKHHKTKATFSSCASPKAYRHLKHGRYTFEVRAFNSAGPDPTPATKQFKV